MAIPAFLYMAVAAQGMPAVAALAVGGRHPPIPYRRLATPLVVTFGICAVCGLAMGAMGFHGLLTWTSYDLEMLVRDGLFRPPRFLCVYGVHLGAYIGGAIGVIGGIVWIVRERKRARPANATDSLPAIP